MNSQVVEEFEQLRAYVAKLRPERTLEIGSYTGDTLRHWMELTTEHLVSIDLVLHPDHQCYAAQRQGHEFDWPALAKSRGIKFDCFDEDSTSPETVQKIKRMFTGLNPIDFLFIDADHRFRSVVSDYLNYGRLVRKGGIIALHDTAGHHWPDVKAAWEMIRWWHVNEQIGDKMGIGVLWVV